MIASKTHEDPRITRTRKLLVEALNELTREKSFDSLTVSEIAARATLNRVTFYAHFQDKFALLEYALASQIRTELEAKLGAHPALSEATLQNLLGFVCEFLEKTERHCPPPRGQMGALIEKLLKEQIGALLLGCLQAAGGHPGRSAPTVQQTATVTAWAIYGAAHEWSQQRRKQPMAEFVRQVLPLVTASLAAYWLAEKSQAQSRRALAGRAPSAMLNYYLNLHQFA